MPWSLTRTAKALLKNTESTHLQSLIKGFAIDNADHEVTHLQFAVDTIMFCDASLDQVVNLKFILKWFEL